MKQASIVIWIAIAVSFARGLFVFDMGPSAEHTYPVAGGLCMAGAVIAAAIMMVFHVMLSKIQRPPK